MEKPFFKRLSDWFRERWFTWCVLGFILLVMSPFLVPQKPTVGKIENPSNNQMVMRTFKVEGSVENLPRDNGLWLAVKVGDLFWPKVPKINLKKSNWSMSVTSRWSLTISEGGTPPGGRFTVVLLSTTSSANEEIDKWFDEGVYSGIPKNKIPGIVELDEVTLNLRKQ
jgi:hypothetical protein